MFREEIRLFQKLQVFPNLSYVHVCGGGSQSERQGNQLSSFVGDQGRFWWGVVLGIQLRKLFAVR